MRKKIVAANWKMNKSYDESMDFIQQFIHKSSILNHINEQKEVIIAAPFLYLVDLQNKTQELPYVHISAQNCHQKDKGAFTGEVSATQLSSIGVEYVILGHSERREYFGESDALILEKTQLAIANGLKIIFCCGESLTQRESNQYKSFIQSQLENSVFQLTPEEFSNIVIAYEPIWAIGTGKTASTEQAQEVHLHIRNLIAVKYGINLAQNTTILYGGSCNPQNASSIFSQEDVDGGLIGGASLQIHDFEQIILAL